MKYMLPTPCAFYPNREDCPQSEKRSRDRSCQNRQYRGPQAKEEHAFLKQPFPNTQRAAWETVWIPQPALLGDEQDMHEIVAAITKLQKSAKELLANSSQRSPAHAAS